MRYRRIGRLRQWSLRTPNRTIYPGETPSPVNLPPGCRFRTRCPVAYDRCALEDPALRPAGEGHEAACLLVDS